MSSTRLSVRYHGNRDGFPSCPTRLHFNRQYSYVLILHSDGDCTVRRARKRDATSITVPDSWGFSELQSLGITEIEVTCDDGMISICSNDGTWETTVGVDDYASTGDETVASGDDSVASGDYFVATGDETVATGDHVVKNGDEIPPSRFPVVVKVELYDDMKINLVIPPSSATRHVSVTTTGWQEVSRTVVNRR